MALSAVKKEPPKPQAQQAAPADAPQPRKRRTKLYAALALLVLAAAGAGTAWWLLGDGSPAGQAAKPARAKPPVFTPLETFTVNLQLEEQPQFAQIAMTLRLTDEAVADALKRRMPEVRHRILMLLSSKKASELLTLDGKRRLAAEIQSQLNEILAPTPEPAPAAAPVAVAAAPTGSEAPAQTDSGSTPDTPAAPAAPAPAQLAVNSVLFTAFIIQ